MLQHKFSCHLRTSLDFGMNKRMNASSWKKVNANSKSASTSLTLCCFQSEWSRKGRKFLGQEGLRGGLAMSKSNPWCGQESLNTCVLWEVPICHQPNKSIKLPLCTKTITSCERNVERMCSNLFHKFVCFNQHRLRWSAYDIKHECVHQHNPRCSQCGTHAMLNQKRNPLRGGRREYARFHLTLSTLQACCIIANIDWSWWRCRGRILFFTLFPFTSLWCHNMCGRWCHFQCIFLLLNIMNFIQCLVFCAFF